MTNVDRRTYTTITKFKIPFFTSELYLVYVIRAREGIHSD